MSAVVCSTCKHWDRMRSVFTMGLCKYPIVVGAERSEMVTEGGTYLSRHSGHVITTDMQVCSAWEAK